jgi:hypothetical protein
MGVATSNAGSDPDSYKGFFFTDGISVSGAFRSLGGGKFQIATDGANRSLSFATDEFVECMLLESGGDAKFNFNIRIDEGYFAYFKGDESTNGSVRLGWDGTDLVPQKRVAGSWVNGTSILS